MERKFFMNDFEESLKEQADQFKMIPSKKVWHGIYNDLHPGRRWPSITISLLLVFTLVGIGYLNSSNSVQLAAANAKKETVSNLLDKNIAIGKQQLSQKIQINKKIRQQDNKANLTNGATSIPNNTAGLIVLNQASQPIKPGQQLENISNDYKEGVFPSPINLRNEVTFSNGDPGYLAQLSTQHIDAIDGKLQNSINNDPLSSGNMKDAAAPISEVKTTKDNLNLNTSGNQFDTRKKIIKVDISNSSSDAAKKLLKLHRKKNEKINWEYYAAPTMNTVTFKGQALKPIAASNFSIAMAANQRPSKVLHSPSLGFEAGAQMNYMIIHKLQFTSGIHLTYSGYKVISNEVHPTFATLTLKDPSSGSEFSKSYITHYGDGTGQTAITLHNYNWQLSVPVGMQYEIGGSDKIRFSAGANIEPSLVIKSNAYILSSDGRNYVNDPSLLRKWNLSSNFDAFMSFKAGKYNWNIGPNVRYQWLSTYQKSYTVKEHLIDYGIRIAISK
jgi:hypothetical protein